MRSANILQLIAVVLETIGLTLVIIDIFFPDTKENIEQSVDRFSNLRALENHLDRLYGYSRRCLTRILLAGTWTMVGAFLYMLITVIFEDVNAKLKYTLSLALIFVGPFLLVVIYPIYLIAGIASSEIVFFLRVILKLAESITRGHAFAGIGLL